MGTHQMQTTHTLGNTSAWTGAHHTMLAEIPDRSRSEHGMFHDVPISHDAVGSIGCKLQLVCWFAA
jgi:hypothetical protein